MQHILDLFLMMLFFVMLLPAAAQYQWSEEVTRRELVQWSPLVLNLGRERGGVEAGEKHR